MRPPTQKEKTKTLLQPVLLLLLPHVAAAAATVAGRLLGQWLPAPLTFARAITTTMATTATNLKSNFIFLMECNQ